jgi:hypothetical protein
MTNRAFRFGPIVLTTTLTTNLLNPATLTGGVNSPGSATYIILRRIIIVNKTALAATFSLWLGATGGNVAGTELAVGFSIPANSYFPLPNSYLRLDAADFLVGGSNTATALTLEAEGEVGVAG